MKKYYLLIILIVSFLSLNAQENLVTNGDLEVWETAFSLTDWVAENNVSQNTSDPASGFFSASLSINQVGINPKITSQVPLINGITYNISYKFKYLDTNYGGTHPIALKIIKDGSATTLTSNRFASNNNWTEVTKEFTPDTTGDYTLSISTTTFDDEGFIVLIDDVLVYDPNDSRNDIVNIPDVNFKHLFLPRYDVNNNGEIEVWEAEAYTGQLYIPNSNISDLTGIEAFININEIVCNGNNLTFLDLSKNVALENLTCFNNKITTINLPNSDQLKYLYCNNNEITELDVSNNPNLIVFHCFDNKIEGDLDISTNTKLENIVCSSNKINNLILYDGLNSPIKELDFRNNLINEINLNNLTSLNLLLCNDNNLNSLDLSKNSSLTTLEAHNNSLTSVNLKNGNNTNLSWLKLTGNTNLFCITVDDVEYSNLNWNSPLIVSNTPNNSFSADCANLEYNLFTSSENGTLVFTPESVDGSYNVGEEVTVTVIADEGYIFDSWGGDINYSLEEENTLTFTITSDRSIEALFTEGATASIKDEFFNKNLIISPNPTTNFISITTKDASTLEEVSLYNLMGKEILKTQQTTIDTTLLSSGLYLLKIKGENNRIATKKFIKQ